MSLPPSPSESPAMSGDSSVSRKIDWDDTERALKRLSHHCNSKSRPRKSVQTAQYNPEKSILSKLRSDGSLKNHGELSTQSPNGQRTTVTQKANTQGEGGNHTSLLSINRSSTHPSKENPRTREFSSPSGAASQQTPQQVSTAAGQLFGEQEIITSTTSEEEENMAVGSEAANTSGGQMAEKRKMKRFRSVATLGTVASRKALTSSTG